MNRDSTELDLAAFMLVCAQLALAAWSVATGKWSPALWSLQFIALAGAVTGLALAHSRFRLVTGLIVAGVYGMFLTGFLLGLTYPKAF